VNKESAKKLNETILFLKIDKGQNEKYLATLEVKSEIDKKPVIKTIVQNQTITVDQKLFQDLHRFAAYRRGRRHTRKTGDSNNLTEQIQLEKQVGIEIYHTFLPGDIRKVFEDFFDLLTRRKIKRLVLVIGSNIPAVLNIPFELMRKDMEYEPFVLTNDSFLLTHSIESGFSDFDIKGVEPLPPPLRLLFVSALPVDLPEDERFLELEKEQELLIEAVGGLVSEKKVMVEFIDIASLDEIEKSLSRGQHHIVHFSGHGVHWEDEDLEAGLLFMENEDGSTFAVTGEELANCLKKFSSIKLVVLSACETARAEDYGVAGALIKNGIPAVLGMRFPVGDETATIFTSNLYENICTGKSLDHSMFCARKAVWDNERKQIEELAKSGELEYFTPEWMTPFLYLNQPVHHLIDFSKEIADTAYFFQKPSFRPVEGGKYVGYGFIGRRREIIRLSNLFKKEKRCICIYGQGGIGKTTLAIRFADNFDNGSYNIIQFRGEVNEEKILTGLANRAKEKLGDQIVQIIDSPDFSPEIKLNMLMEQYLSREKVIVLFDNFEDNQVASQGGRGVKGGGASRKKDEQKVYQKEIHSETLKAFLAHLCNNLKRSSYILFTTRYRFPEPMIEGFNLGEMSFPDSFKLINRFEYLVLLKTGEKREIHRKLGGHPRALELLEGYFKKEKITWKDVAAGFKEVEEKEISHDLLLDMLWSMLNHTERRVLKAASVFRGMTVFKGLEKVTGMKVEKIKNVLESLNAFSLVYLEEDTFNIHRLTSTFVTASKMEKSERKKTHILAAEYFEEIRSIDGKIYMVNLFDVRWHLMQAEEWNKAAELTCGMIDNLTTEGYNKLAFELLAEISVKNIKEQNRAEVHHLQGVLYSHFGDYDQALKQFEKSMKIFEEIKDIKGASYSLGQIGTIYHLKGDYEQALKRYKKVRGISEKIGDIASLWKTLHQIGMIYQDRGDYDTALKHYEKTKKISEKIGDIEGIEASLYHIGMIYQGKGDYELALKQYEKAMEISEKRGDIKAISLGLHQVGIIYLFIGDYDRALKEYEKSMEIREKIGDIKGVAENLHQIGMIYQNKGDYDEALKQYEKAMHICEKIGDIKGLSAILGQTGIIYQNKGDYELALEQYRKSITISEKIGDANGISANLHQIGNVHFLKGEYNQALMQYKKSMVIRKKIGDAKGVAENLHQIGNIYLQKGEYNQAVKQCEKSMRIREKIMDINGVAEGFCQMGSLYFGTKEYTKSLKTFIKSFLIFAKLGSPKIHIAKKNILIVKETIPREQFNNILNEFNLPPSVFDDAEKERRSQLYEDLLNITFQAVNAKEKKYQ
jgi:tetratricopeptide (TPR) repeat protein